MKRIVSVLLVVVMLLACFAASAKTRSKSCKPATYRVVKVWKDGDRVRGANVRDREMNIRGSVKAGTKVTVIGWIKTDTRGGVFAKCERGGKIGYIYKKLLEKVD